MKSLEENLQKINNIDLRYIIERCGGEFINNRQFRHDEVFGYEKTPSNFIFIKSNGKQIWKHFKDNTELQTGDAVDYVRIALNKSYKEAIEFILGNESELAEITESKKQQIQQQEKEQKERQRHKMFAIEKNSIDVTKSFIGINYLDNRGILKAFMSLKNPNFRILVNKFTTENGKKINNICYYFNKSKDNNHRFMIVKGVDEKGNKNGVKLNYLESRPIMHQESKGLPFIVCEGIEDALSGVEFGYKNFISLNSTSNVNRFLVSLIECPNFYKMNKVEICLDNDEAGKQATNKIKACCYIQDLYSKAKIKELIDKLKNVSDNNKDYTIKVLSKYSTIEEFSNLELQNICSNLSKIDNKYHVLTGYGDYFKITESVYVELIKEMQCKDLNEFLIKTNKEMENLDKCFDLNINNNKKMER